MWRLILTFYRGLNGYGIRILSGFIAWLTVRRFGGSPVIGLVSRLMLVAPQLPNAEGRD